MDQIGSDWWQKVKIPKFQFSVIQIHDISLFLVLVFIEIEAFLYVGTNPRLNQDGIGVTVLLKIFFGWFQLVLKKWEVSAAF